MEYKKILAISIFFIIVFGSIQLTYGASSAKVNEVAREFICNCGCNKLLPNCDMGCGVALRGVIGKKIDAGWDKERIIAYMIKNYNEQILSAPTKKGFNLTAWVTPFIAIALGGLVMGLVILAWAKTTEKRELVVEGPGSGVRGPGPEDKLEEKPKVDEKYKEKLDEELKDFDW